MINTDFSKLAQVTGQTTIDQSFELPVDKDTNFTFSIKEAKKTNFITNQGKPLKSGIGKEFLIITLEIKSPSNLPITVNSLDFIRLIGEGDKKYAPDFYNEAVTIPADAVKRDDVGFIVDDAQKQFKLVIGEVDKDRAEVEINF